VPSRRMSAAPERSSKLDHLGEHRLRIQNLKGLLAIDSLLDSDLRHKTTMNTSTSSTVVGVFEDRIHANKAVTELHQAGFTENQIGVAMQHAEGVTDVTGTGTEHDSHAASGALTGALAGLGLGALTGLGVLAGVIPVVGPAIAAGTLGVILSNAAAGAGIAGLVGALVGAGIPEHEAKFYQGELEAGRSIVTVNAGSRSGEATTILRRCGGYDMSSRAAKPSLSL
jgi:Heat induced stress protein YflT domain